MNGPMVGFGRTGSTTLAVAASVGAMSLTLADASAYSAGKPVLVSGANGSDLYYCGLVTGKTSNTINVSVALGGGKGIGAKVWQPATFVALSLDAGRPIERLRDTGVKTDRTLGGKIFSTRLMDAKETLGLQWELLEDAEVRAMLSFLQTNRNDGLNAFGCAWFDGRDNRWRVAVVRYRSEQLRFSRSHPGSSPLELPLWIETMDAWQEA